LNFGDLHRLEPFCESWGTSRGGALDRFFIERFLKAELSRCRGNFLECGGIRYRHLIPSQNIVSYDVLDIDNKAPGVTICGDIEDLRSVPSNKYHVVICTQVLQYVNDPKRAIAELHRILRRRGRLFLSVPFIEKDCARLKDKWRFTKSSIEQLLGTFHVVEVCGCGNLFSSICYLAGLGQSDIEPKTLIVESAEFYHVVLGKAQK